MTVTNTTFSNSFTGDGVTTAFNFTWRIVEDQMIAVYVNGVLKTNGTDYTFTDNKLTSGLGGTVTFNVAPANGAVIVICRQSDQLQNNNLQNNQAMPAATVMSMIDKLTCLIQDALRVYQSADTTIANGTLYTFAHGLCKQPTRVRLMLVCQNTDGGYAAGDVIEIAHLPPASVAVFCTVQADFTNVYVRTVSTAVAACLNVVNKSTFAAATISPFANWKLRVYAS